jgi:hypothetical protein
MIGFLAEGRATPPPAKNNFGDTMTDGIAGPLALLIILLLAVATVLLVRNMNSRLRRLPESFPAPTGARAPGGGPPAGAPPGESAGNARAAAGPAAGPAAGQVDRGAGAGPPGD